MEVIFKNHTHFDNEDFVDFSFNGLSQTHDYVLYEFIKKQIERYHYSCFFFKHCLDQRTRIYTNSWPLNYQLNHLVRSCIRVVNSLPARAYRKFFDSDFFKKNKDVVAF